MAKQPSSADPTSADAATAGDTSPPLRAAAELVRLDSADGATPLSQVAGAAGPGRGPGAATVARWLEALAGLARWSACSDEFAQAVARFPVESVGLDAGALWRREADGWRLAAWHAAADGSGGDGAALLDPATLVDYAALLDHAAANPGVWFHPTRARSKASRAAVVATFCDASGRVAGGVTGVRQVHASNGRRGLRHLEARLVGLLARAAGDALARFDQELDAARGRALLEQAFAPEVVRHLLEDPAVLAGSERNVTVLFADVRDFSSLCQALSTEQAYELLADVMDALTDCVLDRGGVVIDYYGDGLAAMWNAPLDQPEHARLACEAGIAMLDAMPTATRRWREWLGRPVEIGVGVHTGAARVGNAGSRRRLKYGPRGATVNIAHRVQGATRRLGLPMLVTQAVRDRLADAPLATMRICRARLSGIDAPLDLYGVRPPGEPERIARSIDRYEAALRMYEEGRLVEACALLDPLSDAEPGLPKRFLTEQVKRGCCAKLGRRSGDEATPCGNPVIDLRGK